MTNELTQPPSEKVYVSSDLILNIENLEIKDRDIVELFISRIEQGENAEDLLEELIKIGAKVAVLFNSSAGAELIKSALSDTQTQIQTAALTVQQKLVEEIENVSHPEGSLQTGIASTVANFRNELEQSLSSEDAPIRMAIGKSLNSMAEELQRNVSEKLRDQKTAFAELLDPEKPTSPLRILQNQIAEISRQITEMRTEDVREEGFAEGRANTTFAGLEYEDRVIESLQKLAASNGDTLEKTGSRQGNRRNDKSGDGVSEILAGGGRKVRLILEAKDKALTASEWRAEAKKARENRGGKTVLGLCSSTEYMPNAGERLWFDTNQLIVIAYDPLHDAPEFAEYAYKLMRTTALVVASEIDTEKASLISEHISASIQKIHMIEGVIKEVSGITKTAEKVQGLLGGIQSDIDSELSNAQRIILGTSEVDQDESGDLEIDGSIDSE